MMKLKLGLCVLVTLFCVSSVHAASSQSKLKRIKFGRGATSVTVVGKLNHFDDQQTFVLEVRNGQSMKVEQITPNNRRTTLTITDPTGTDVTDMDASCNNQKLVKPTVGGDYRIRVFECKKADPWKGSYSLKITVK